MTNEETINKIEDLEDSIERIERTLQVLTETILDFVSEFDETISYVSEE
jgi:archaellum component FlaC